MVSDAFAFESTVKNEIQGIGVEEFDNAQLFGSDGTLASVVNKDRVSKYGDDPTTKILGENSTLAVLAHETGHRWLARLLFSDRRGGTSDLLLGRQRAHWSFFMDSDASVMEGNDIADCGGGSVPDGRRRRTLRPDRSLRDGPGRRRGRAAVLPCRLCGQRVARARANRRRVGTTFSGTRRHVLIRTSSSVLGPRVPSTVTRVHRQAFIYMIRRGTTPSAADLSTLGRIRQQWEPFFRRITENRMTVTTSLR